jgi:copper chaperone CopZ
LGAREKFTNWIPRRNEAPVEKEAEGEAPMHSSVPYVLHRTKGRVRVKLPALKGSSAMTDAVAAQLGTIEGVKRVHANPTTGSVVVYYTHGLTSCEAILGALQMAGFSAPSESTQPPRSVAGPQDASPRLTTRVFHLALDLAVQRLLMALVP